MKKLLKIQIDGAEYVLEFCSPHDPALEGAFGVTQSAAALIKISSSLKPDHTRKTIDHELCHGLMHESGCASALAALVGDDLATKIEEVICTHIGEKFRLVLEQIK